MSEISHLDVRQKMIATALEMTKQGINQGTAGNISYRTEEGLLITPTSLPYEVMTPEDIVAMKWDGSFVGRHRPSSEWRFHRDILKNRTDMNVVLHNHATYTTVLATHERGIPPFHYMTAVAGGHDIRVSKYATFGTQELSDEILIALKDRYACIMGHHGMVTVGKSLDKALALAIEVETLAKMYVHALAIGEPPHLSGEEMDRVIEQIRRMSYGNAPDLDHVKDTPTALS